MKTLKKRTKIFSHCHKGIFTYNPFLQAKKFFWGYLMGLFFLDIAYCPQGPQWSSFARSTFEFIVLLQ